MSRSVGIDIGSYSVKLAEVESSTKGFRLLRYKEIPLSQDPNKDRQIEVIDILRTIANVYDADGTQIVLALNQSKVSSRRLQFPFRERHKINRTIGAQLEDQMPFDQENTFFEAKITHFLGTQAQVIATSCPRSNIQEIVQLGIDGDLDVDIVSAKGLALANLFEDWSSSPKEFPYRDESERIPGASPAELILDIGHTSTIALIYKEGLLLDVKSFDWGGKNIADALARKYKIHYVEAIKELRQKSYVLTTPQGATKDQITFSNVISEELDILARQVQLTLLELKSVYNIRFEKAHLLGGVSRLKNIAAYLTQKLEVATNRLKNPPLYPFLSLVPGEDQEEPTSGLAVGLAIEGLKKPINPPTNFLHEELAKKNQNFKLFWHKWAHAIQLATAAIVIFFFYSLARDNMALTMSEDVKVVLQNQGEKLAGTKRLQEIERFIKQQERTADVREDAEALNSISSAIDVLRAVSSATPKKNLVQLNVSQFKVNDTFVEVIGEIKDRAQVQLLERAYQGIAVGKINPIPGPATVSAGWIGFGYKFSVKRIEGVSN